MPLQSRIGTVRVPGEGWLTPRDRAPTPSTGGSSPGEDPSGVHDRRFGMTRHVTGQRAGCPFLPEPRSTSGMCLQLYAGGLKRMTAAQQSRRCLVPCSTTELHQSPLGRSGCRQVVFMPGPRVTHPELAPPFAAGYKMYFSGGFLFRAVGSARVQNVTFAGVFVPQVWNQHAGQSVSRNRPVEANVRLYHAVHGSYATCCHNVVFLYTSRTSSKIPKLPRHGRQGMQDPSSSTLHPAPPPARLDYGGSDPSFRVGSPIDGLPTQSFDKRTHNRTGAGAASTNLLRSLTGGTWGTQTDGNGRLRAHAASCRRCGRAH